MKYQLRNVIVIIIVIIFIRKKGVILQFHKQILNIKLHFEAPPGSRKASLGHTKKNSLKNLDTM